MQLFILLREGKCIYHIYHCYLADQFRNWKHTKSGKPWGFAAFSARSLPTEGYPQISVLLRQALALRSRNRRIDRRLGELLVHFIQFNAC